jgi:hypothetical protein
MKRPLLSPHAAHHCTCSGVRRRQLHTSNHPLPPSCSIPASQRNCSNKTYFLWLIVTEICYVSLGLLDRRESLSLKVDYYTEICQDTYVRTWKVYEIVLQLMSSEQIKQMRE